MASHCPITLEGGQAPLDAPVKVLPTPSTQGPTSIERTKGPSVVPVEDFVPWIDKGKSLVGDIFLNNPNYAFKKMTGVIPKGDVDAFMKFSSSAIYQWLVLDLTEVTLFFC